MSSAPISGLRACVIDGGPMAASGRLAGIKAATTSDRNRCTAARRDDLPITARDTFVDRSRSSSLRRCGAV
jgi:hypothetical protein